MFCKILCDSIEKLAQVAAGSHSFLGCYEPEKPKILNKRKESTHKSCISHIETEYNKK